MTTVVIGGGPAGLISAYFRAARGEQVFLIEKNEKLGKKLYITGKGRCNVTNDCDETEFLDNVVTNPKFLMGAIRRFPPEKLMEFLGKKIPLKTERGNRVFPLSDKASDVTKCLESYAKEAGVEIGLNEKVLSINACDGRITSVKTDKREIKCDNVIVCTGGLSYPSTGSDGDGYGFAESLGHTVVKPVAALCGLNLKGDFYKSLQGISLKNVNVSVYYKNKKIYSDFGEMLFTHFGVSGPLIISASSYINKLDLNEVYLSLDLKPALTEEQLIIKNSGADGETQNNCFKSEDRRKLVKAIKDFRMYPYSLRDISEAIVTSGGVSVKEIDPKTMESKLVKGLYFAGEVIDVDALTGGFNITIAACTAYSAGNAVGRE